MQDCTAPEHVFEVFINVLPTVPFGGIILFAIAVVLMSIEAVLTFRFGGVPDGIFGTVGAVFAGIAILVWSANWPTGCQSTVGVVGWILIGLALLIGAVVFLFWRARRRDGGMWLRDGGGY